MNEPMPEPHRIRPAALAALTVLGVVLCTVMAYPFLPAVAWAVAMAVMAYPLHSRLQRSLGSPNWAAGLSTAAVVAVILVPMLLVAGQLTREAEQAASKAEKMTETGRVETAVAQVPRGSEALEWFNRNIDREAEARNLLGQLVGGAGAMARGSAWFAIQTLVCVFILFFAFRDRQHLLESVNGLLPLTHGESHYLFTRVSDSIHATVYATVLTGVVQGATGGLLFFALGIPAPILWAAVMTVLAILPLVGAVLVWLPAAIVLALDDRWGAAATLVIWGVLMAGPVGNWLYARLAGGRMRLHPVPVLLAYIGGLAIFGVSGMVIGPVVLAVTLGLLEIWKLHGRGSPALIIPPASATAISEAIPAG